jgi:hypothetical protein
MAPTRRTVLGASGEMALGPRPNASQSKIRAYLGRRKRQKARPQPEIEEGAGQRVKQGPARHGVGPARVTGEGEDAERGQCGPGYGPKVAPGQGCQRLGELANPLLQVRVGPQRQSQGHEGGQGDHEDDQGLAQAAVRFARPRPVAAAGEEVGGHTQGDQEDVAGGRVGVDSQAENQPGQPGPFGPEPEGRHHEQGLQDRPDPDPAEDNGPPADRQPEAGGQGGRQTKVPSGPTHGGRHQQQPKEDGGQPNAQHIVAQQDLKRDGPVVVEGFVAEAFAKEEGVAALADELDDVGVQHFVLREAGRHIVEP